MAPPEHEDEAARIDREWEAERDRYLITSRYIRGRYAPSAVAAVMIALFVVGVGAFCFAMDFNNGDKGIAGVFTLIGWAIIVVGLAISLYHYGKARRYRAAYRAYLRRRPSAKEQPKAAE